MSNSVQNLRKMPLYPRKWVSRNSNRNNRLESQNRFPLKSCGNDGAFLGVCTTLSTASKGNPIPLLLYERMIMTMHTIQIARLSVGSIYKLFGVGFLSFMVPFSTLMGVLALFGFNTVRWNGQPLTGALGLLLSPFIGLFIAGVFTLFVGTLIALGLWLFSWVRPMTLKVKDLK